MKHVAIKGLREGQTVYKLDSGELVLVSVRVDTAPDGAHDLTLQGWQVNKDGTRYLDPEDKSAVIIPIKLRRVIVGTDGPSLDDEIADAHVAIVNRLQNHIEARSAIKKTRAARAREAMKDKDRDTI